jgi:hypothetical protein
MMTKRKKKRRIGDPMGVTPGPKKTLKKVSKTY